MFQMTKYDQNIFDSRFFFLVFDFCRFCVVIRFQVVSIVELFTYHPNDFYQLRVQCYKVWNLKADNQVIILLVKLAFLYLFFLSKDIMFFFRVYILKPDTCI